MTWIMATWNGLPYTMTMRRFDTRDDAELAAYTWMIEQNIIGPDLPIDEMLEWWFDTEDGGGASKIHDGLCHSGGEVVAQTREERAAYMREYRASRLEELKARRIEWYYAHREEQLAPARARSAARKERLGDTYTQVRRMERNLRICTRAGLTEAEAWQTVVLAEYIRERDGDTALFGGGFRKLIDDCIANRPVAARIDERQARWPGGSAPVVDDDGWDMEEAS